MEILQIDGVTRVVMSGRELAAFAGLVREDSESTTRLQVDPNHRCAVGTNGWMAVAYCQQTHFPHRTKADIDDCYELSIGEVAAALRVPPAGAVVFDTSPSADEWRAVVLNRKQASRAATWPALVGTKHPSHTHRFPWPDHRPVPFDEIYRREPTPDVLGAPVLSLLTLDPIGTFMRAVCDRVNGSAEWRKRRTRWQPGLIIEPAAPLDRMHGMLYDPAGGYWLFVIMPLRPEERTPQYSIRTHDLAAE